MPLRPSLDDSSQLAFLWDRVRSLERELLGLRGHADVWKSKEDRGAAREEYLMAELLWLSEQLQCKLFFVSSCSSVLRMCLLALRLILCECRRCQPCSEGGEGACRCSGQLLDSTRHGSWRLLLDGS